MGQIAHLHAGPVDDFKIGLHQQIEFIGHRLHFGWKVTFQHLDLAAADFVQFPFHQLHRFQTKAYLEENCRQKPCPQHGKETIEGTPKGFHFCPKLVKIARHKEGIFVGAAIKGNALFNGPQLLALAIHQSECGDFCGISTLQKVNRGFQWGIQQRFRNKLILLDFWRNNLPIPARPRQAETCISQPLCHDRCTIRCRFHIGRQPIQHSPQPCIEITFQRLLEQLFQQQRSQGQQYQRHQGS